MYTATNQNGMAGTWRLYLSAWDLYTNADYDDVATVAVRKLSMLTTDATPRRSRTARR
ncbi:hypothetical protein [Streptomyces sp. VNUA24]|uniref:hypothetical protein n=1 Tax=Streptomyces sp. VNUA24 TaxID=3031131 RepID=UPI0031BA978D